MEESMFVEFPLLQLPEDLLQEFLMACDPEDVLTMEKTCKTIYRLSNSKHLWVILLAKLDYDQAPDVGPHVDLDSLQAKEVKRIVVRALTSYNNWRCPDGPQITREQKVQLESHQHDAVKVLPGCQYLIVQSRNYDCFGVWDINRETLVVRYQCNRSLNRNIRDCALIKGGKIARVAFLRDENPDHIEVVDLDLHRGHATLLFSESIQNVVYSLTVREDAVISMSDTNILLLIPETGKIAIVTAENLDVNFEFDIVRGTLICLDITTDGMVRLSVAKLSRIFEHTQGTESIPLKDICEIRRVLTFIQLNPRKRYTLTICDPLNWGSARPCRILIAHIDYRSSNSENKTVQVHRLYLEGSHNGSDLALTYGSSSNCVPLEESSDRSPMFMRPSIPGRWMLLCWEWKGKYDIMVHRLWEGDVRLSPSDIQVVPYVTWKEAERFSGTQIFYLEDGNCILHFFD